MNDAISYIRVSSEVQADSGLGLEAQRQRIAAYCTMKGCTLSRSSRIPESARASRSPGRRRHPAEARQALDSHVGQDHPVAERCIMEEA
jgi:DNA invertase Pin-like site-specific DNA recombinase